MLELNFAESATYFRDKRMDLIDSLADIEEEIRVVDNKLNKSIYNKKETILINSLKQELRYLREKASEYRKLINMYYVAQESIRTIILLKRHKNKHFDKFMESQCDIFGPAIRKKIYEQS